VFALSQGGASSSAARWLANKENQADLVGGLNVRAKDAPCNAPCWT
jgi:N-acetylmuramoyl-L-alanine amidase